MVQHQLQPQVLVAPLSQRIRVLALATCLLCLIASSDCINVITRSEWGAQPPTQPLSNLKINPPPYVVVHHAATPSCTTNTACANRVREIQRFHINDRKYIDIAYNFLIGEDGNVYEGRGWGKTGAHATIVNPKSIGICIIGTFTSHAPNESALNALRELIADGKSNNMIASDYKLIAHKAVKPTECPGTKLVDIIKEWPHYSPTL